MRKTKASRSSSQADVKNRDVLDLTKLSDIGANLIDEVGEVTINSFLQMDSLKNIPLVGPAINAVRGVLSVRDYFFARKVLEFLRTAPKISPEARQKFKAKLDSDPNFAKHTASYLTVILDRLDDIEKTTLLARLFGALVSEKIDQEQHRRLSTALERAFLSDLHALRQFLFQKVTMTMATFDGLQAAGLVFVDHSIIRPRDPAVVYGQIGNLHFGVPSISQLLVEVAFNEKRGFEGG